MFTYVYCVFVKTPNVTIHLLFMFESIETLMFFSRFSFTSQMSDWCNCKFLQSVMTLLQSVMKLVYVHIHRTAPVSFITNCKN